MMGLVTVVETALGVLATMQQCMQAAQHPGVIYNQSCSFAANPSQLQRRSHRRSTVARLPPCAVNDDDTVHPAETDWRAFRAKLVAQTSGQGSQSESNLRLLELSAPNLAAEGVWAHQTPGIEQGCVLLSTPAAPGVLVNDALEQVVVFIANHGTEGTVGLILNRPSPQVLGRQRGGLRFEPVNAPEKLQQVFAGHRVYMGGWVSQNVVFCMHGHPLPKAVQIVPGLYLGGEAAAAEEVEAGRIQADDFKFFLGALVWEPGQLEREILAGCWYTLAVSRSLVLKPAVQLPTPLWREIMLLAGGNLAEVAAAQYEGDEVSGE